MPRRPFPVLPRGPRRNRVARETVLLACPRVSPAWELAALRALMKPQAKGAIEHAPATQPWAGARHEAVVRAACRDVHDRIGYGPRLHFPGAGDYWFAVEVPEGSVEEAKGFALVLSTRLPGLWFTLGKLFLQARRWHRRERGFKLNLIEATDVHLTRPIRAALRDLL